MSLNPDPSPKTGPTPATTPARRTLPLTLVVVLLVLVAAVGIGATATYYALKPAPSTNAPTGATTVTVVDDLGRSVTAPTNAHRVVVLAPSIMDLVFRLGLRSDVVGVGCTTSIPGGILNEYTYNQTVLWDLSNSTCVTDYPSLNTEGVANDTPGLVLAPDYTSAAAVDTMTDTYHLPVVVLSPTSIDGIVGDVRIMGQLYPAAAANCTALETQLSQTLASVAAQASNVTSEVATPSSVLISYYFDSGGYYTYGPGTFGASMIDLVGGSNVASAVPLAYGEMNATAVLNDQPQVIIYGTEWNDPYVVSGQTPSVWAGAPYWAQLTGTKIAVDVAFISEPDPTMILWLPWLQHDLYPSLVPAP